MTYLIILVLAALVLVVAARLYQHRVGALANEAAWRSYLGPWLCAFVELATASTIADARAVVQRYPNLLDPGMAGAVQPLRNAMDRDNPRFAPDPMAETLLAVFPDARTAIKAIDETCLLLRRCQELGTESAFLILQKEERCLQALDLARSFSRTSDERDANEALTHFRLAVKLAGDCRHAAECMDELSGALVDLHRLRLRIKPRTQCEAPQTLDEAILWGSRATEASHHIRLTTKWGCFHSNLGIALRMRYAETEDLQDLDRAIKCHQTALTSNDEQPPQRAAWLKNLGNALYDRFFATSSLDDLDEAIACHQQAVAILLRDAKSISDMTEELCILANCLMTRASVYPRNRASDNDRLQAARLLADVSATSSQSASEPGTVLLAEITRTIVDISSQDPGGRMPPAASRDHTNVLDMQLMNARIDASMSTEPAAALTTLQQAMTLTRKGSTHWRYLALQRARTLREYADRSEEPRVLTEAQHAYQAICREVDQDSRNYHPIVLHNVMQAALEWGTWASERRCWPEASEAFCYGLAAMNRLSHTQKARSNKEVWLDRATRLSASGAYAAVHCNDLSRAVASLEQGRAVLLREALESTSAGAARLT